MRTAGKVFGSLLVVVIAFGVMTLASARPHHALAPASTFTLDLVHVHFQQTDTGRPGASGGDVLAFDADLMNEDQSQRLGRQDGQCVFTRAVGGVDRFEVCLLSFMLEDGELIVEGMFDQREDVNVFAVTGGTGAYEGARGQVEADFSEGFVFNFELLP